MNNFLRAQCSGAKNFFPLPNAIFSLGLSTGELAVYLCMGYVPVGGACPFILVISIMSGSICEKDIELCNTFKI